MATIQEKILEDFFNKLSDTDKFTEARILLLRETFETNKKPNASALMAILSVESEDDIP